MDLKQHIRHVPDFPKAGILFYDITTLLRNAEGFAMTIDMLSSPYRRQGHRSRRRHREPRLHPGRGGRRAHQGRVHSDPQAGQAAVEDAQGELRARVRDGLAGSARGRDRERAARPDRR